MLLLLVFYSLESRSWRIEGSGGVAGKPNSKSRLTILKDVIFYQQRRSAVCSVKERTSWLNAPQAMRTSMSLRPQNAHRLLPSTQAYDSIVNFALVHKPQLGLTFHAGQKRVTHPLSEENPSGLTDTASRTHLGNPRRRDKGYRRWP